MNQHKTTNKWDFETEWKKLMAMIAEDQKAIRELRQSIQEVHQIQKNSKENEKKYEKNYRKHEESLKKNQENQQKHEEKMRKYDEAIRKNEEKLSRMGISFGNFQNNIAESTEDMFYYGLSKKKKLANVNFDTVLQNVRDLRRHEYDIVMQNGSYIALIEVKQKAHQKDLDALAAKQLPAFREGFKIGTEKKILLGIASPVVTDTVRKKAEEKGILILTQSGENVTAANSPSFKPRIY